MLRLYSVAVLLLDIILLNIKVLLSIFESIYLKFVAPVEKSVSGEIVVVSTSSVFITQFKNISYFVSFLNLALNFNELFIIYLCIRT